MLNDDEIWARVRRYATGCMNARTPIYTTSRKVRNFIVEVTQVHIARESDDGRGNNTVVRRRDVLNLWNELRGSPSGEYLVITRALLAGALPEHIEVLDDGKLLLRRS